jgi:glycosyltransferase involved in cell wall biosynthesis
VTLQFAGYETVGHRGYVTHLLDLARKLGLADRVHYHGTLPDRAELLDLCCRADVGVALFPRHPRQPMSGASNKPFDYLACGLALLVPDSAEWRDSYVVPGLARACDPNDPESIASVLLWFLEHADDVHAMGMRGRRQILESWNYESQFRPIYALMNS